jgi:hypothetical protein
MPDTEEIITMKKGSPAELVYRAFVVVALMVIVGIGGRISGTLLDRLDKLIGLPKQVEEMQAKQVVQGDQITGLTDKVDKLSKDQAGSAAAADLQELTGRVDKIIGRVDTMETTINSLVRPAPSRPPK